MNKEQLIEKITLLEKYGDYKEIVKPHSNNFFVNNAGIILLISFIILIIIFIIGAISDSIRDIDKEPNEFLWLCIITPPTFLFIFSFFTVTKNKPLEEILDNNYYEKRKILAYEIYNEINKDKEIPIRNTKLMKEYVNKNNKE